MNILHALILGIVEGVTEFLPISSTAHLILASRFLNIPQTDFQKFFEVFIQSGAILAVFFLYLKFLWKNQEVQLKILASFLPTAIVGFLLFRIIKDVFFESTALIVSTLLIIGVVFLVLEFLAKRGRIKLSKEIKQVNFRDAIFIGFAQSLAVMPGVSRAGIVIVAMMLLGYKREDAAVYSFLLAIPTILAASALDFYREGAGALVYATQSQFLLVGFITSFVTAYFSVKWLIGYLKKNTLTPFGIYRIALAIIVMLLLGL